MARALMKKPARRHQVKSGLNVSEPRTIQFGYRRHSDQDRATVDSARYPVVARGRGGIDDPGIWTGKRDREMRAALQGG
jgi:hypothetical protein